MKLLSAPTGRHFVRKPKRVIRATRTSTVIVVVLAMLSQSFTFDFLFDSASAANGPAGTTGTHNNWGSPHPDAKAPTGDAKFKYPLRTQGKPNATSKTKKGEAVFPTPKFGVKSFNELSKLPNGDKTKNSDAKKYHNKKDKLSKIAFNKTTDVLTQTQLTNGKGKIEATLGQRREKKDGKWQDFNTNLQQTSSGLSAKHAKRSTTFAQSSGAKASIKVNTTAGTVTFHFPGLKKGVKPTISGDSATYKGALSGEDLTLRALTNGSEQIVTAYSSSQSNEYLIRVSTPKGTKWKSNKNGVSLVDKSNKVALSIPNGTATDNKGAETPAKVSISKKFKGQTTIKVSVDKKWWTDQARQFPIAIDPTVRDSFTAGDTYFSGDTSDVASQSSKSYWGDPVLRLGRCSSGCDDGALTELNFNLRDKQAIGLVRVSNATITLHNTWSSTCTPLPVYVYRLGEWKGPAATWDNQSGRAMDPHNPTQPEGYWTQSTFSHGNCDGGADVTFDVTNLAQMWMNRDNHYQNFGVQLDGNLGQANSWKKFDASNTANPPRLTIDYEQMGAGYSAARSWTREQVAPTSTYKVDVWVQNTGPQTWTPGGPFKLHAGINQTAETDPTKYWPLGDWAPTTNVVQGQWIDFQVDLPAQNIGPGNWAIEWTMREDGIDRGEFFYYESPPRVDVLSVVSAANLGDDPNAANIHGVNSFNGNYLYQTRDLAIPGVGPQLEVARTYNSRNYNPAGWFGMGWTSTFETKLFDTPGGIGLLHPDGRRDIYFDSGDHIRFNPPPGVLGWVQKVGDSWWLSDGANTVFMFNANKQLGTIVDENGQQLQLSYDTNGRLKTLTNVTSRRHLFLTWGGPDASHQRVTKLSTDPRGATMTPVVWTYKYDTTFNYLTDACEPRDATWCTHYEYNAAPVALNYPKQLTAIQPPLNVRNNTRPVQINYYPSGDAHGGWVRYMCDAQDASCNGFSAHRWSYTYNKSGAGVNAMYNAAIMDPAGNTIQQQYNVDGGIRFVTNGEGKIREFQYGYIDNAGAPHGFFGTLTAEIDESGNKTAYNYDEHTKQLSSKVVPTTTPGGAVTSSTTYYGYDDKGHVTATIDGRGTSAWDIAHLTSYTYDSFGNFIKTLSPPDATGKRIASTKAYTTGNEIAVGATTCNTTTHAGCMPKGLLRYSWNPIYDGAALTKFTRYDYDDRGNTITVTNPSGVKVTYTYDDLGRVANETQSCSGCPSTTTTFVLDQLGNVIREDHPKVDDSSGANKGEWHQEWIMRRYDENNQLTEVDDQDINHGTGGDAPRYTYTKYDDDGRVTSIQAPGNDASHVSQKKYDVVGNLRQTIDALGNVTQLDYDRNNQVINTWAINFDDLSGHGTRNLRTLHLDYYDNGLKKQEIDPLGRTRLFTYDAAGKLFDITVKGYHPDPRNTTVTQDLLLERHRYDGAGNEISVQVGASPATTKVYDALNRMTAIIEDPNNIYRRTDFSYDVFGNVLTQKVSSTTRSGGATTTNTYDAMGRQSQSTTTAGTQSSSTYYAYNALDQVIGTVGPDGTGITDTAHRTDFVYDQVGRKVATFGPAVSDETISTTTGTASSTKTERPSGYTSYDTWGNTTRSTDANGQATTVAYNANNQPSAVFSPQYTAPGSSSPVTAAKLTAYDELGRVKTVADSQGSTDYTYDALGRTIEITGRAATSGGTRPKQHFWYDDANNQTASDDPVLYAANPNLYSQATQYDDLNRPRYQMQITRPTSVDSAAHTQTTYQDFDKSNRVILSRTSNGAETKTVYNGLGEVSQSIQLATGDTPQETATTNYDIFSNPTDTYSPMGYHTKHIYDSLGRLVSVEQHDSTDASVTPATAPDTLVSKSKLVLDNLGRTVKSYSPNAVAQNATTPPFGTTFDYDNGGRLVGVTNPTDNGATSHTTIGHDANGNITHITDGRNNTTYYTYNSWNLPERTFEPATAANPALVERTYTRSYDIAQNPVKDLQPGNSAGTPITINRVFDNNNQLKTESGSGPNVANASRSVSYDLDGRTKSFGSPSGNINVEYDDRGLVAKVTGPRSGTADDSSYVYNDAGMPIKKTEGATTMLMGYNGLGQVKTLNSQSGAGVNYSYNADNKLTRINYGSGANSSYRTFTYNESEQPRGEYLYNSTGAMQYSIDYTKYDADGNLLTKTVGPTAVSGAGTYSYGYDQGDRLKSYTAPGKAAVGYAYDNAGNRVLADGKLYSFDERNRLTSDTAGETFAWSPRGDLTRTTSGATTANLSYDAFGRMTAAGASTYSYDDLDRISAKGSTAFTYAGLSPQLISTGTESINRTPSGAPLETSKNGVSSFVFQNSHGDVNAEFGANGTPTWASTFDPYGKQASQKDDLGFQGNYTDSSTGMVWMNARWYLPSTGGFGSRDSIMGDATNPSSLNRYTYGEGNPVGNADPSGHSCIHLGADGSVCSNHGTVDYHPAGGGTITTHPNYPVYHRPHANPPQKSSSPNPATAVHWKIVNYTTGHGVYRNTVQVKLGYNEFGVVVEAKQWQTIGYSADGKTGWHSIDVNDWRRFYGNERDKAIVSDLHGCTNEGGPGTAGGGTAHCAAAAALLVGGSPKKVNSWLKSQCATGHCLDLGVAKEDDIQDKVIEALVIVALSAVIGPEALALEGAADAEGAELADAVLENAEKELLSESEISEAGGTALDPPTGAAPKDGIDAGLEARADSASQGSAADSPSASSNSHPSGQTELGSNDNGAGTLTRDGGGGTQTLEHTGGGGGGAGGGGGGGGRAPISYDTPAGNTVVSSGADGARNIEHVFEGTLQDDVFSGAHVDNVLQNPETPVSYAKSPEVVQKRLDSLDEFSTRRMGIKYTSPEGQVYDKGSYIFGKNLSDQGVVDQIDSAWFSRGSVEMQTNEVGNFWDVPSEGYNYSVRVFQHFGADGWTAAHPIAP